MYKKSKLQEYIRTIKEITVVGVLTIISLSLMWGTVYFAGYGISKLFVAEKTVASSKFLRACFLNPVLDINVGYGVFAVFTSLIIAGSAIMIYSLVKRANYNRYNNW